MTATTETVTRRGTVTRVVAGRGYLSHVRRKALLVLNDTGNGYIARFPSHSSAEQDGYACLDYAQAHSLWLALSRQFGGGE